MKQRIADREWERIFKDFSVINKIKNEGHFIISSKDIKKYKETRLMTKFDTSFDLPQCFKKEKIGILPLSRQNFILANFDLYHKLNLKETDETKLIRVSKRQLDFYETIETDNITSEAKALNVAFAAGIIEDFTQDKRSIKSVSGRMTSGSFEFKINQSIVNVEGSQIEIDAGFEGEQFFSIIEAKNKKPDDFLIRQLYYPYRLWKSKISKKIKNIFLTYENNIFTFYEYDFLDVYNYNSIYFIKKKSYSFTDKISEQEIIHILKDTEVLKEPEIPFPQANDFNKVIGVCESLRNTKDIDKFAISNKYGMHERQGDYYLNAARYLRLVIKEKNKYIVSEEVKKIFTYSAEQKQLFFVERIFEHKIFRETYLKFLENGRKIDTQTIVNIMKMNYCHNINKEDTYYRRAETIRAWILWILSLTI